MKASHLMLVGALTFAVLASTPAFAEPRRDAILAELLAQARRDEPGFGQFSAERGAALYRADHTGGKPGTASCTACHGNTPLETGQTRAGKAIDPMALSKSPGRYTDKAKVEKWFTRNGTQVLGRACTAKEKGDFLTYVTAQ
ncbi:MAG: DUF1924 domain-containing protein [Deltaproteobacteria bacterium]|nr:DUF1924 domain-containing protein [Deltaproteobacteria bacterium]